MKILQPATIVGAEALGVHLGTAGCWRKIDSGSCSGGTPGAKKKAKKAGMEK